MRRRGEDGVILVNVLVALALGAALVTLMLTSQDGAIDRTRRAAAAAQAEALALGAETSVMVALRRDMAEAPEADSLAEPWAAAAQQEVVLATGRFAVKVRDAQAGLDLNGLAGGGLAQAELLRRLVAELQIPAQAATLIEQAVRADAPLLRLEEVEGLDPEAVAALAPVVAFLPVPGAVNLNTADPVLMGVVLGSRTAARRLAQLRDREGMIDRDDLAELGLVPGPGVGFRSDVWDVEVLAEVDGVAVTLTSRLLRLRSPGLAEVVVIARRFGAASGPLLPLPEEGI